MLEGKDFGETRFLLLSMFGEFQDTLSKEEKRFYWIRGIDHIDGERFGSTLLMARMISKKRIIEINVTLPLVNSNLTILITRVHLNDYLSIT